MKKIIPAALLIAGLAAMPALAAQATSKPQKPAATGTSSTAKPASHSTSGKVKSIDATTLVLAHSGKDMTFMIDPSTQKEGAVDVGSEVTVRYHADGGHNMATAITAKAAKPAKK